MKRILQILSQKWPEYILEILVITIGILGAFALNNWNEGRKSEEYTGELITQLIMDYEANLVQLNQKIELHYAIMNTGFSLLDDFDNPASANLDSVLIKLITISIDPTFDPITNNLEATGEIKLIKNPELNRSISNWSSDIVALRELELVWQNTVSNHFVIYLSSKGIYRDVASNLWDNSKINSGWLLGKKRIINRSITRSSTEINLQELLSDKNLEGLISFGVNLNQVNYEQAMALQTKIERTLLLLNEELNK